jgi:hypothetical protein
MASTSTLGNAAMRIYDKVVHEQIFKKNVLWNNVLRNVAHAQGATTKYFTVHYGRNVGFAAGSETVTLPTAGSQAYLQSSISMKYQFHTVTLTDVALQASQKSKEYLVNALESEYNGAKEDMQRQLSRQGYGIGTGVVCRVNDAGPDATLTFDTPMVGKYPTDYFEIDGALMFSDSATSASTAVYALVKYITSGYDSEMTANPSASDDDYVYLAHTNGSTPTVSNVNAEIMGLKGLIDDNANVTTLQGISRDTYIWWKSYISDNSTQRSLTEALMHETFLEAKKKGDPKYILTSYDVYSAYGQLLSPDRRYTDKLVLNGGFTGWTFNDMPVIADFDMPYDEMYFVDPSVISVEDLAPISFLNEDGSILDRSSTTPSWNATLRYYANLAISAPNKCSGLRDIIK